MAMGDLTKNISRWEIQCKHCGELILNESLIADTQRIFDVLGYPYYRFRSGYRCAYHNMREGGGLYSQHLLGNAFDIETIGWTSHKLGIAASMAWNFGMSVGIYSDFIHWDKRPIDRPENQKFWRGEY
jgi:hypothetical protein